MAVAIEGKGIIKEFGASRILHDLSFRVEEGEFVSISGRSGSGKSTLLYIMSTLDLPTQGTLAINGRVSSEMTTEEVHLFRSKSVGFVFQFHYLLPELTSLENVLLAPRNLGCHFEKRNEALGLLERFGLASKSESFPAQMSGGEQQRVAIARALIMRPKFIFADEPTGNLDTVNAAVVMELLREINREGATILMVTHDSGFASMAGREIHLVDGRIKGQRDQSPVDAR